MMNVITTDTLLRHNLRHTRRHSEFHAGISHAASPKAHPARTHPSCARPFHLPVAIFVRRFVCAAGNVKEPTQASTKEGVCESERGHARERGRERGELRMCVSGEGSEKLGVGMKRERQSKGKREKVTGDSKGPTH